MLDINKRFEEHKRIDNYLKRRSMQISQNQSNFNHENKLSYFPIGLIIITKDEELKDKIEFINQYACQLFQLKDNSNIKTLKEKFDEYIKLKYNSKIKGNTTLKDLIFNSPSFNLEIESFFPFQCKYSKSIILYIKINDFENEKYIVIDKYDKFVEEQKYIEFNLIKNINYQYLHTLYHELNNPLNALLAISGDKTDKNKYDSSEIRNSKIYNKHPSVSRKKTIRSNNKKAYKKDNKQSGITNLDNSKNKIIYNNQEDNKFKKKKSIIENDTSDESSRINLLVKIIKIFIKNFILYLKTRADNLLSFKNEFKSQNEASDIMNAVEVSEYEKDLTNHKNVKLNLEYILDLYIQKYHCLFKYKEIEYDTNFSELKNLYVIVDDFNFSYYIRQIYTYLYYVVPKKEGFYFEYDKNQKNKIKIIIKKKVNGTSSKITEEKSDFTINQLIQTKEMTKEVLYSMTQKLKFSIEIFDTENNNNNNNKNNEQNNYLSITIPVIKKDKLTEIDEFKDKDINENIGSNNLLLEEKLKRQLPGIKFMNEHKNSNNSTIQILDVISKNGDDKKDNTDSYISFPKNINFKNDNNINNNNLNLNFNSENQKNKYFSFINSKSSNDSFLSKCLKITDNKKPEKEKKENSKFKNNTGVSINLIKNKIDNHSSNKNIFINITNINNSPNEKNKQYAKKKSFASSKGIINRNSVNLYKSQKTQQLKGIFSLINKYGYYEQNDTISEISYSAKKIKNYESVSKGQSPKPFFKKGPKEISFGTLSNFNLDKRESGKKNSISISTAFFGKGQTSKPNFKSSCFISDIGGGLENNEKNKNNLNININNKNMFIKNKAKNGVHIEYIKEENEKNENNENNENNSKNSKSSKKSKNSKKLKNNNNNNNLKLSSIEDNLNPKKRNSHNISSSKSNKDYMTFFDKNKNKLNHSINHISNTTLIDDNLKDNNLFFEATKERNFHLQKNLEKNKNANLNSESNINEEDLEEEEDCEENEEMEENEEENIPSQEKCKCADILVVDDEEFNVMASQKMLKNLGFESDKAYNGEECIKLINDKKTTNCQCEKNHYKIIFLDIVMPVMDGIKTAKKIQEMVDSKEMNEDIKIIFISGNIDGSDLQKSLLEINCVKECLQKPVQISKYQKLLEKYYNKT